MTVLDEESGKREKEEHKEAKESIKSYLWMWWRNGTRDN